MMFSFCMLFVSGTSIAAPLAQFWIQADPFAYEFMLLCSVSQGDNFGLAGYNVPLDPDPTSYVDTAPMGRVGLNPFHGFIVANDWQGANPTDDAFSGQNSLYPATLIRGIGQGIVDITDPGAIEYVGHPNPPTEVGIQLSNNIWGIVDQSAAQHDYAIVLAQGAYTSTLPSINFSTGGGANVFEDNIGTSAIAAELEILPTIRVPEPCTLLLFTLGGLALRFKRQ